MVKHSRRAFVGAGAALIASKTFAQSATPEATPSASPIASPAAGGADVQAAISAVQNADVQKLVTALKAPIPNESLPEGFADALLDEQGIPLLAMLKPTDSIGYMIPYTPPYAVEEDDKAVRFGYVNYQIFEEAVTPETIATLKADLRKAYDEGDTPGTVTVEDTDVNGVGSLLIASDAEADGLKDATRMLVVPIDKVLVVTDTTIASGKNVLDDVMRTKNEELSAAAITHLAEQAKAS